MMTPKTEKRDKLILAVITARGGSKGLPGKNIKPLGGKPLIAWTIDAAKKSREVTHLIVSTDDGAIAGACRKHGADVPFMRPAELAVDKTPHLPVMQHAVSFMENKLGITFDYIVILQPTSPFRTAEDLDGTIERLIKTGADSAVSVVEVDGREHPVKMKKIVGDFIESYCVEETEGTHRQDLPPAYKRSGAVYAMRRKTLMEDNRLYGNKVAAFIVPKERSVDIDTPLDWIQTEYMYERLKKEGKI